MIEDLFERERGVVPLAPGAMVLRGFAQPFGERLIAALGRVVERAPFRHMVTPGGHRMSVAMTNCGATGWVTDRVGYRYDHRDPESGRRWPAMPDEFAAFAVQAAARAGFDGFAPDACLVNGMNRERACRSTRIATSGISKRRSSRSRSACRPSSCSAGWSDVIRHVASPSPTATWPSGEVPLGSSITASCRSTQDSIRCWAGAAST
jgi:2OG-Fe(II) oxygenase superfamily